MEKPTFVEVFECGDNRFNIIVEPALAIAGVRKHLESQSESLIMRDAFVAGDLAFEITGNVTYEQVLRGAGSIIGVHKATGKRPADASL